MEIPTSEHRFFESGVKRNVFNFFFVQPWRVGRTRIENVNVHLVSKTGTLDQVRLRPWRTQIAQGSVRFRSAADMKPVNDFCPQRPESCRVNVHFVSVFETKWTCPFSVRLRSSRQGLFSRYLKTNIAMYFLGVQCVSKRFKIWFIVSFSSHLPDTKRLNRGSYVP